MLWQIIGIGLIAIVFAIIADGLAALPTVIKSYKFPETENWLLYFANAVSAGITILTIKVWNLETFAFPLYILFLTGLLSVLIKFEIGKGIGNKL